MRGGHAGASYASKRIIVADLDGTLAESKSPIDAEMAALIGRLLRHKNFAVISGGRYQQFHEQMISRLPYADEWLSGLYIFPTNATSFYRFAGGVWRQVYAENLTVEEKDRVYDALKPALKEAGFEKPQIVYGDIVEDRGTQITFSALGQKAPLALKAKWDPDAAKRRKIKGALERLIPDFEIGIGGTTSIDISRKGIDKAYGIRRIQEHLMYSLGEMLYIGDALFEGGNDFPVKRAGVDCVQVGGVADTKRVLGRIIADVESGGRPTP